MIVLSYENCWEGFLSAVFEVFLRKDEAVTLQRQSDDGTTGACLYPVVRVAADTARAARVAKGIAGLREQTHTERLFFESRMPEVLYRAWLSDIRGVEDDIVQVLQLGFQSGANPLPLRQIDAVKRVNKAAIKTGGEAHRFLGYIRFVHGGEDIYMANIRPESHILPLIGAHFCQRYGDQRLIIQDVGRRQAIVSDGRRWAITQLQEVLPLPQEGEFEVLWKRYFTIIANPARKNTRLQQQFVPLKYREFLVEFGA